MLVGMRLQITRRADLAVKFLVALAARDDRAKAAAVADDLGTTAAFLAQVAAPLVRRGWIRSDPGPAGGYTLVADLASLTVLEVIEAVDGAVVDGQCVVEQRPCTADTPCLLHHHWADARSTLVESLGNTTVDSLTT